MKYLIVDDDPAICRLLDKILSSHGCGHLAFNGHEATGIFRVALEDGQPYDLVCLDIGLPTCMNGHQVLQALRGIEFDHDVGGLKAAKMVMVTGSRESKDCISCFSEGADAYIVKPIDKDELLARLGELGLVAVTTA